MNSVDAFVENFRSEDDALAAARARAVEVGSNEPTAAVGALSAFFAELIDARNVVEARTGVGLTALWLLRGLDKDAVLTSIDAEAEHIRLARESLAEYPTTQIRLISGDPLELLGRLTDGAYDMVSLRLDARDLAAAIEESHRLLRAGGILFISNALGDGKVPDPAQRDEVTIAIREAGRHLRSDDQRWRTTLIPVGDGVLVAFRL